MMAARTPQRHWRSYGTEPLPPAQEALNQPFRAFPSWFLRIECDRCGKATLMNEARIGERRGVLPLRVLFARMCHEGCGGKAGWVELLTGIDGSSRPVRRIVLWG
jgi:hypothetical protein